MLVDTRERKPFRLHGNHPNWIGLYSSDVHPNAVCGLVDAIEAKFGIPFIYASTVKDLATERAASWLSKHFTYWWLEQQGLGRVLIDSDRL